MTGKQLIGLSLVFIGAFAAISALLVRQRERNTLRDVQERVAALTKERQALFDHIETGLKPSVYRLQKEGKLGQAFFDPHLLSSTYIARGVHQKYLAIEAAEGSAPRHYFRLAATNPTNPINQGSEAEVQILERFRRGELDSHSEIIHRDGRRLYVHYKPVAPSKASCLRCHGDPADAPGDMIARYGDQAGFGEQEGWIRAMMIVEAPLDDIEAGQQRTLLTILALILAIFTVSFVFIIALARKERALQGLAAELRRQTNTDGLTGLANRRRFDAFLAQQWAELARRGQPLSLLLGDIDFFKRYNDTYGHLAGDDCLVRVAQALAGCARRPSDLAARYGGEEFAVVLPDTDAAGARVIAEEIRAAVEGLALPHEARDEPLLVTVSIGVHTVVPAPGSDPEALILRADEQLYAAKEAGRNRVAASVAEAPRR